MSAWGWVITGIEILIIIALTILAVVIVALLADEIKKRALKLVIVMIPVVIGVIFIVGLLEYNRDRSIPEMLSLPGILLLIGAKSIIRAVTNSAIKSIPEKENLEKGVTDSESNSMVKDIGK